MKQVYADRNLLVRAKTAIDQLARVGKSSSTDIIIRDLNTAIFRGDQLEIGSLVWANCDITEPYLEDNFYPEPDPESIVIPKGAIGDVTDLIPGQVRSVMVRWFYGMDKEELISSDPEGWLVSPSWINKIY